MAMLRRRIACCGTLLVAGSALGVYFGFLRVPHGTLSATFTRTGQVLVPARVGGIEGLFLLDTGSQSTIVTPQFASGLEMTGHTREVGSDTSAAPAFAVPRARSGGIQFASGRLRYPEHVDVIDLRRLAELVEQDIDGILGWDVLRAFVVGFDGVTGRVVAGRKLTNEAVLDEFEIDAADATVDIEIMGDKPFITAQSQNEALKLMIDTGSSVTSLYRASRDRVSSEAPPDGPTRVGWSITGETTGVMDRLEELQFGPLHLTDVAIQVRDLQPEPVASGRKRVTFDGLLGMDILSRYVVVIDGPGRKLCLAKRRPAD